jgi:hypothetical protein
MPQPSSNCARNLPRAHLNALETCPRSREPCRPGGAARPDHLQKRAQIKATPPTWAVCRFDQQFYCTRCQGQEPGRPGDGETSRWVVVASPDCLATLPRHGGSVWSVRRRRIHEGGKSHAAKPAPASMPNAKTVTPAITQTGVRDAKALCVARRGSAMGTRQRSRPQLRARHDSCRPPSR